MSTQSVTDVHQSASGTWVLDPGHAEVAFVGRHFGLTKVRGRFTGVTGTIVIAEHIADSSVDVDIDMTSVSSGNTTRDDHLRSPDFFDVANHPTASFRSTSITVSGSTAVVHGVLTIKNISRPLVLDVEYLGHATDPWGAERSVFSASATINREDWGLTWNMVLDAGGLLVSKDIRLEIEAELVLQS